MLALIVLEPLRCSGVFFLGQLSFLSHLNCKNTQFDHFVKKITAGKKLLYDKCIEEKRSIQEAVVTVVVLFTRLGWICVLVLIGFATITGAVLHVPRQRTGSTHVSSSWLLYSQTSLFAHLYSKTWHLRPPHWWSKMWSDRSGGHIWWKSRTHMVVLANLNTVSTFFFKKQSWSVWQEYTIFLRIWQESVLYPSSEGRH